MEKKALKILILLFVIPAIIGLIIAFTTGENYGPSNNYNSLDGRYNSENNNTYEEKVKGTNTFVYICVFSLVVISVGVWAIASKKGSK